MCRKLIVTLCELRFSSSSREPKERERGGRERVCVCVCKMGERDGAS